MVIAKINDELSCFVEDYDMINIGQLIGFFPLALLIMIASGYVLIVHLLFKDLCTLFGILLIFHSFTVLLQTIAITALLLTHNFITVNSQIICHTIMVIYVMAFMGTEVFATDMLTHLAYTMYRCHKLKSDISTKKSYFLFKWFAAYAFGTLFLFALFTLSYDLITGSGKSLLLPNGRCSFLPSSYEAIFIRSIFVFINKVIQITMFITYLVYFYKVVVDIGNAEVSPQYWLNNCGCFSLPFDSSCRRYH